MRIQQRSSFPLQRLGRDEGLFGCLVIHLGQLYRDEGTPYSSFHLGVIYSFKVQGETKKLEKLFYCFVIFIYLQIYKICFVLKLVIHEALTHIFKMFFHFLGRDCEPSLPAIHLLESFRFYHSVLLYIEHAWSLYICLL